MDTDLPYNENVRYFMIYYDPDLTEARGLNKHGVLLVHAKSKHDEFAEHWCYEKFGNRVGFCMGTYGSNALVSRWRIQDAARYDLIHNEILDKIEEEFVEKIW